MIVYSTSSFRVSSRSIRICTTGTGDSVVRVRRAIERQESSDFIDASRLSKDTSRDGVALLDSWTGLRNDQTSAGSLLPLLRALGFEDAKVIKTDENTFDGEKIYSLKTRPIADRRIVGLPDFGSRASGEYRLFVVRGRTNGEAVIREADKQYSTKTPPNIALFLGLLDAGRDLGPKVPERQRRRLGAMGRHDGRECRGKGMGGSCPATCRVPGHAATLHHDGFGVCRNV